MQGLKYVVGIALLWLASLSQAQGVPGQIDGALQDLSNRVGQTITLQNNTLENWLWSQETFPDSSLGCPQEGQVYAQVLTAGYIFELTYQGTIYEYHVSADGQQVVLCNQASSDAPTPLPPLEEQYSNPLCPAPTTESGAYPRSYVEAGTIAEGTLAFNRLRAQASTDAQIVAEIPQNGVFEVVSGPECDAEGIIWWQIDFDGIVGWTAEAQGDERFIQPRLPDPFPALKLLTPESAANLRLVGRLGGNILPDFTFSPDASLLAVLGDRGSDSLLLYNANDLTQAPRIIEGQLDLLSLDFHPNGQQVMLSTDDGGAHLWNIMPEAPLLETIFLQTHLADVQTIQLFPDGSRFASAGLQALTTATDNTDNAIILWDIATVSQVAVYDQATSPVTQIAFAPDGARLAAVTTDGTLLVWDVNNSAAPIFTDANGVTALAYSPNGQFLAIGRSNGAVDLLDASGNPVATYTGHLQSVSALAFSDDSRLLASGSLDGAMRLWSTQSDANVATVDVKDAQPVATIEFVSSGLYIAASTNDGDISFFAVPAQP